MSKKFLVNIDLNKNELQNVVIHRLATAPSAPENGQLYFNTSDERAYQRQTTGWKDVSGSLDDILAGSTAISLTDNGDNTITLDVLEASGAVKGLMSPTDKTKLDAATSSATANTLVLRDANGDITINDVTANQLTITSASTSWGANSAVTKSYVDNLLAGGIKLIGVIDASTNPLYPAVTVGDAYHISVAGKIGGAAGQQVEVGDMVVAVNASAGGDEATVGDDFIIMQKNIDAASTDVAGTVRLATQAEVDAGTATDLAISPATLAVFIENESSSTSYAASMGNADTTTTFIVNHGFNTTDVQVQLKDNSTLELVEADVTITDVNNVTVHFNLPPALDAYRAVVQGIPVSLTI